MYNKPHHSENIYMYIYQCKPVILILIATRKFKKSTVFTVLICEISFIKGLVYHKRL